MGALILWRAIQAGGILVILALLLLSIGWESM
ncbi:MAG: hypothetical protein ACI8RZ_007972 [Myxococcota bacterium]|jgi:hypothetical protein